LCRTYHPGLQAGVTGPKGHSPPQPTFKEYTIVSSKLHQSVLISDLKKRESQTIHGSLIWIEPIWSPTGKPVVPINHATYAKASVGHPPVSEIRRSMVEWLVLAFPSRVTHSSTAKAVVSCVGG
jgi:hypothetical protein